VTHFTAQDDKTGIFFLMSSAPTPIQASRDPSAGDQAVSLSQVLSALSHALDLTEGQPAGHTVRACLIGMDVARELALDAEIRSALYYALLLKDAGCSSNAAATASLFGSDDHTVKRNLKTIDWTRFRDAAAYGVRNAAVGRGMLPRVMHTIRIGAAGQRGARDLVRIRCERGAAIVTKLGFPQATAEAVRSLDEHWDGNGHPDGKRGGEIPLLARIALLAQTLEVFAGKGGHEAALAVVQDRAGTWFDPELVRIVCSWRETGRWQELYEGTVDQRVIEAEPEDRIHQADGETLDRIAQGFAEVIDAKSPYTFRHSSGVADYARRAGRQLGFDTNTLRDVYRAGLLHDIGKLAVSNRILDKNGPLTPEERRVIEQHPVYTWTILSKVDAFASIARTASLHHEKLDGTGYPWNTTANELDMPARLLAVADVFEALTARRPYRAPMPTERALGILQEDAEAGRLDADCLFALKRAIGA
jgi:putative nucleotidyltransferase with HDIG domain